MNQRYGYLQYTHDPVIGNPEFGVFFFGIFYLMYRGLWFHVLMMLLFVIPTLGLVYVWYIFKTRQYLARKLYIEGYFDHRERESNGRFGIRRG